MIGVRIASETLLGPLFCDREHQNHHGFVFSAIFRFCPMAAVGVATDLHPGLVQ